MKQPVPERRNKLKSDSLAPALLSRVEVDWLVRIIRKLEPNEYVFDVVGREVKP